MTEEFDKVYEELSILNEGAIDSLRTANDRVELAIDKIGAPVLASALGGVFSSLGATLGGLPGAILGGLVGYSVAIAGKKINKLFSKIIDKVAERKDKKFEEKFTKKINQIEAKYGKELNDKQKAFIRLQMTQDSEVQKDPQIQRLLRNLKKDNVDVEALVDLINDKLNINLDPNDEYAESEIVEESFELKEAYRDEAKLFAMLDKLA